MGITEKLYFGAIVLWDGINKNKSLLICGGIAGELITLFWTYGYSASLEQFYKTLSSVSHYKYHIGTLICGSIATGISKVVLNSWADEIEKTISNTPPTSPKQDHIAK